MGTLAGPYLRTGVLGSPVQALHFLPRLCYGVASPYRSALLKSQWHSCGGRVTQERGEGSCCRLHALTGQGGMRLTTVAQERRLMPPLELRAALQDGLAGTDAEDAQEQGFVKALLLAWFASQHRSLFAAKCLVETVGTIYLEGYTLDDIKLALSFAGFEYGGKLLDSLGEDILLSWVAIIMMSLKAVGVEPSPEGLRRLEQRSSGSAVSESEQRMSQGLQMFVRQCVDMYLSGTDLYRLQLQQSMAGQSVLMEGGQEATGPSPAVVVMQQNTRLVIITLEVIKEMQLPTDFPLAPAPPPASAADDSSDESVGESQPRASNEPCSTSGGSGGSSSTPQFGPVGFIPSFLVPPGGGSGGGSGRRPGSIGSTAAASSGEDLAVQKRAAAVRLLMGFMGAASGWLYPAWDFIDSAADCYQLGWTADELFSQLRDEEFAQSGGVLPVGVAGMGSSEAISATLFANWLSLVYMTMAQMGVPHPGAGEKLGWAWVCSLNRDQSSSSLEAQGVADFVSNTLRLEAEKERLRRGEEGGRSARGVPEWAAAAAADLASGAAEARREPRDGFVVLEDPSLARTSGFALLLSQQISLVQMTWQRVLAAAGGAGAAVPSAAPS